MRVVDSRNGYWKRVTTVVRSVVSRAILMLEPESPPGGTGPAEPFMLPHERMLIAVRKHPGMLTGPVGLLVSTLIVASLITAGVIPGNAAVLATAWGACLVALLGSLATAVAWSSMFLTVTDMRLITLRGHKTKKVFTVPLPEAGDFIFERPPLGRLVGYGTFVIASSRPGQGWHKITYLPYPEQLYLEVCGLFYRDPGRG